MNNKKTAFIYIFAILAFAAIICLYMEWKFMHYTFRALIVPSLLYLLLSNYKKFEHPLIPLLVTATFFKFIGDLFFLVEVEIILFRLFAICTFTVANIGYGLLYFFSIQKKPKIKTDSYYIPEITLIAAILIALWILLPYLGLFQVPATIYVAFTCFTLVAMTRRRKYFNNNTYLPVMAGTTFFLLSDTLRGFSIFVDNPLPELLILLFYSLGHYYIIHGMAEQFKEDIHKNGQLTSSVFN